LLLPFFNAILFLPFAVADILLNALTFLFFTFYSFFFYLFLMFFKFFINFFSDFLNFFLLPEFLIFLAALISLLAFVYTKFKFTSDYFFSELAAVFGKEMVEKISIGSYEYSVLIRFHNAKKRLTALFYS